MCAFRVVCLFALLLAAVPGRAAEALVAVAASVADAARELEAQFEADSGHRIDLVIGSTGKLYAQITSGAPFDVLLAADQARPRRLEEAGFAVPGSRRTYAEGRLVLWSPDGAWPTPDGEAILRAGAFRRLAIANPRLAPYGLAAVEALRAMSVYEAVRDRIVVGENVAQAHAMVASGNAELGLIALSSVVYPGESRPGSRWSVPADLYAPIRHDAVLLARAAGNPAAGAFLEFLDSDFAVRLLGTYGYGVR